MTSVPHSGAKSVTPGGSVAGEGHTKGPWVVTSDGHYVSPAADLTKIVALVFRPDTDSETERHDNARLIAAAPDLLAVASGPVIHMIEGDEAMVRLRIGGVEVCAFERGDWRATALILFDATQREAIAKATAGETRNAEGAL